MGQQGVEERIQHEPWTRTTAALDLLVLLLTWNGNAPSVERPSQNAPWTHSYAIPLLAESSSSVIITLPFDQRYLRNILVIRYDFGS